MPNVFLMMKGNLNNNISMTRHSMMTQNRNIGLQGDDIYDSSHELERRCAVRSVVEMRCSDYPGTYRSRDVIVVFGGKPIIEVSCHNKCRRR